MADSIRGNHIMPRPARAAGRSRESRYDRFSPRHRAAIPDTDGRARVTDRKANRLVEILQDCERRAAGGHLSLGEVLDSIEEAGYGFICIFLVLPFLQPLTLGPLAIAGGLTFAILGWQMYRGHPAPVLPEKIRQATLGQKAWRRLLDICITLVRLCGRITRQRHSEWVSGVRGARIVGSILMWGGLLMAIPFFGIPLNNFLPGLAIFFVCLADLEQDGVMVLVAIGWIAVTLCYFVFILLALWYAGGEAIQLL
jgi:hypothetical protein